MGGCRCYFRDCKVSSSRNPGIHFFHFPKRNQNLDDWIRFSCIKNYSNLTESQQKNKVICGRHFKTSCFMNYKQGRLTPSAVPTLTRLSPEWALDYEQDLENPKLMKIDLPNAPHLIPPAGFKDPQCFNSYDLKLAADILKHYGLVFSYDTSSVDINKGTQMLETQTISKSIAAVEEFTEEFLGTVVVKESWSFDSNNTFIEKTENTVVESMETENCSSLEHTSTRELEELTATKNGKINEMKTEFNNILETKNMEFKKIREEFENLLEIKNRELKEIKVELESKDARLCCANKKVALLSRRNKNIKQRLTCQVKENQQLKGEIMDAKLKYDELMQTHNELKKQHDQIEPSYATQEIISSSEKKITESQTGENRAIVQPPQLNKQQLFNGIKRYLSQTMVALLRLQLVSTCITERDWKPDEKRVATDLLSLGEHVYSYFTDEWLIRLPSINLVLEWRNQNALQDDEDEI